VRGSTTSATRRSRRSAAVSPDGRVEYYIDGQPSAVLRKDIPDRRSRLLLNHWSGHIPTFGGPAPAEDADMQVNWVYYSPDYKEPTPGSLQ
jgi:beta-glucanase (GH16 family)